MPFLLYMDNSEYTNTKPCFETNFNEMKLVILILYSFNKDIDIIRKYARTRFDYGTDTSFGVRTMGIITDEHKHIFNSIFSCIKRKVKLWSSFFLFISKYKPTYNHIDIYNDKGEYAAVCYLNDIQLRKSGLILYNSEEANNTLSYIEEHNIPIPSISINTLIKMCRMNTDGFFSEECNKLLLYKANHYHHIFHPYGENASNSRLGHTFFFTTNTLNN